MSDPELKLNQPSNISQIKQTIYTYVKAPLPI